MPILTFKTKKKLKSRWYLRFCKGLCIIRLSEVSLGGFYANQL